MRTALSLLLLTSAASALTTAQGTDVAHKFTDAMTETLASGSMAKMSEELFSDEVEWSWAGGQAGKGPKADLVKEFAGSWGAMVSAFLPATHYMVVTDTAARKITLAFDVTININGRGKAPDCFVPLPNVWALTVDDDLKMKKWEGTWDSQDAKMMSCMGKVAAASAKSEL